MREGNSFQQFILGIFIAVISGIILAYILQEARFDPTRMREQTVATPTLGVMVTTISGSPTEASTQPASTTVGPSTSISPQASESVATNAPTPIVPTPESTIPVVSDIKIVSGKDSDGEVWYAPATGRYRVLYTGGAYTPWPGEVGCDPKGCWKTTVFVYRNRDVVWLPSGGSWVQPGEPDLRIGDDAWQQTPILAEEIARLSNGITIDLEAGEYLSFIAIDGKDPAPGGFSAYSEGEDHEGGVNVQISLVSQ